MIVGSNFCFGKDRKGDIKYLSEILKLKNLLFFPIPLQKIDNTSISSSYIRNAIKKGDLSVNRFLYEPFYIKGIVEKGKQIGRNINYPTANIYVFDQIKPLDGVYFTITQIKNKKIYNSINSDIIKSSLYINNSNNIYYFSMTFVGHDGHVETHIFDFNEDIYGNEIKVYFICYIRKNRYIEKISDLKILLDCDKNFIFKQIINKFKLKKDINYERLQIIYRKCKQIKKKYLAKG